MAGNDFTAAGPVSVLVLTRDEQVNIADCLRTLAFSDDIVVLDSYSTDRTVEIAESFPNVRVVRRAFDTWSCHSNWALQHIKFRHPWVYYSDADERVTPELAAEITRHVSDPDQEHAAFRLRYKNMFRGRWLRHGGIYPVWLVRLFRPDRVRYEDRQVNAHPVVAGTLGELREHFIHYSFNKGLVPWLEKHNRYAQLEAHEATQVRRGKVLSHLRALCSSDGPTRRRALKDLSFHLPGRALARFVYMYLLKRGCLDGLAGLHYALLISMYEHWTTLKTHEREADWAAATDRVAAQLLRGGAR